MVGRCLYKGLGSNQEIGSSRNHLSTFLKLKILLADDTFLSLHTRLLYKSLQSKKEPGDYCDSFRDGSSEYRTIVIVLLSTTIYPFYYVKRKYPSTDHSRQASQFCTI